jgi:nucleotide-binding universal stress UspA family protein
VRVSVQHGDIGGVILLHARAQAPDLIVLGSHEPVGLARLRFRSIADRVVIGASCPVLLVPAGMTDVAPTFRRVVCAIDLASWSSTMVTDVSRIVEEGGQLTFLHVLRSARLLGRAAVRAHSGAQVIDATQRVHSLVDTPYSGSEVLVTVSANSVHDQILRVAIERHADLVVLGATRHSRLPRRFLGSTALRVSRRSPLPVLVLPGIHIKRDLSTLEESVLGWAA